MIKGDKIANKLQTNCKQIANKVVRKLARLYRRDFMQDCKKRDVLCNRITLSYLSNILHFVVKDAKRRRYFIT